MNKSKITKLIPLRKKINSIDAGLTYLLRKRSFIIPKVKKIKEFWNYKIAVKREIEIAKKISQQNFGLYNNLFMQKIWRELISATLFIECKLRIIVYKNSKNYFDLWEITKDHFSGSINLEINEDINYILNELINQKAECIVLPNFKDTDIKWWTFLLQDKYSQIKINMKLPFILGFKTLGNSKGFILSLNDKEVFNDNLLYILEKSSKINDIEILDENENHILIRSNLDIANLAKKLQIDTNKIKFIGSYANPISGTGE